MSRLPTPGSDEGQWGAILNEYLLRAHDTEGTLKTGAVSSAVIQDGAVTKQKLASSVQTSLDKADASISSSTANATFVKTVNGSTPNASGEVTIATGDSAVAYVFVQTGSETRPSASHVIWVGGATRPTNTIEGDVWLSEVA